MKNDLFDVLASRFDDAKKENPKNVNQFHASLVNG